MTGDQGGSRLQRRLLDALYLDAMLLADEARCYFDEGGRADREALEPMARVAFSCESLKVTTRLMHVIAWLLTQRAVAAGEISMRDAGDPSRRLGNAPVSTEPDLAGMPAAAQALIASSVDLHRRAALIENGAPAESSPARTMFDRLQRAF